MILKGRPSNSMAKTFFLVPVWPVRLGSLGLGEMLKEASNWGSSNTASFSWIESQKGLAC